MLWDDNGISIDGALSISDSVDQLKRFQAAGWRTIRVDGHDEAAIDAAIAKAKASSRPTLIACKTVIGWGAPKKAGSHKVHGEPLGVEEAAAAKAALGLSRKPFDVDAKALDAWRAAGPPLVRGPQGLEGRLRHALRAQAGGIHPPHGGRAAGQPRQAFAKQRKALVAAPVTVATRKASELALEVAYGAVPELLSGSADLTPSNNNQGEGLRVDHAPRSFKGRYLHYGIREHAMAAAMNGMALHGGLVPAGGTFFVFTDYCRPAMRLSALMGVGVVYVMTHDSIGLGEDGPTHQPSSIWRACAPCRTCAIFRPCDASRPRKPGSWRWPAPTARQSWC